VHTALTCGTDLKAFRRGHPVIPMPGPFGHEFSGFVTEVGKGVRRFREGDAIMAVHSAPCRSCQYCKRKLYNHCDHIMETKILGAFAEEILLPAHIVSQNVFPKPSHLSFSEAAMLEPLACVVHGLEMLGTKRDGYALIIGAGPIGLLHLLLLKKRGFSVAVMDTNRARLAIAKNLGADRTITAEDGQLLRTLSPRKEILRRTKTDRIGMFDCVFECTGSRDVWEESVTYVRKGGTVILFGGCPSGTSVTYDAGRLHYDEITLRGVFHFRPEDVKKAYDLLCGSKVGVLPLVSGCFPLSRIQHVFELLSKGKGIKYAIIP